MLNSYTRFEYVFTGWSSSIDGKSGVAFGDGEQVQLSADLTLYAQWIVKSCFDSCIIIYEKYNPFRPQPTNGFLSAEYPILIPEIGRKYVLLDGNGAFGHTDGIYDSQNSTEILVGNQFYLPNHAFTGWNTMRDGSGIRYGDLAVVPVQNQTLYAQFGPGSTVYYDGNGATEGSMEPVQSTIEEANTPDKLLSENTFSKIGFDFVEWNTKADGTGDSYQEDKPYNYTSDLYLYAIWRLHNFKITYSPDDNQQLTDDTGTILGYNIPPNTIRRSGFIFLGWSIDSTRATATYADGATIFPSSDLVLYGVWSVSP